MQGIITNQGVLCYATPLMCRFLLIHSTVTLQPVALFSAFADMCRDSCDMDRNGQRDGWGVAWLGQDKQWLLHKSLNPIWEETGLLAAIPASRAYALHARSASFAKDRDNLEFNQPYLGAGYAFTFNGLLRGVSLPEPVAGRIGAQRIWNLLRTQMHTFPPKDALANVVQELRDHARDVVACNIGMIDSQHIYASCQYTVRPDYYQLRWHASDTLRMVCSEPLPGYDFQDVRPGGVLVIGD